MLNIAQFSLFFSKIMTPEIILTPNLITGILQSVSQVLPMIYLLMQSKYKRKELRKGRKSHFCLFLPIFDQIFKYLYPLEQGFFNCAHHGFLFESLPRYITNTLVNIRTLGQNCFSNLNEKLEKLVFFAQFCPFFPKTRLPESFLNFFFQIYNFQSKLKHF